MTSTKHKIGGHPLDNPVWSALTSAHSAFAEGSVHAKRYPGVFARFAAMDEAEAPAYEALVQLLGDDEELTLFTRAALTPPASLEVTLRKEILQMVCSSAPTPSGVEGTVSAAPLGAADAPHMLALVEQARPGPFNLRTHELGRFIGVRIGGRLAAMAGERMHLTGYTEVSAVCTDAAFRGRGLAGGLISAVCRGILARGELPMLHVLPENHSAILLYGRLGFELRAEMRLTVVRARRAGV